MCGVERAVPAGLRHRPPPPRSHAPATTCRRQGYPLLARGRIAGPLHICFIIIIITNAAEGPLPSRQAVLEYPLKRTPCVVMDGRPPRSAVVLYNSPITCLFMLG